MCEPKPSLIPPLLTLVLAWTVVSESSSPKGWRLDLPGQALAIIALGALAFAVIEGGRWGWSSPWELGAAVTFVLALAAFLYVQGRTPGAMMPLDLFRSKSLSASLAVVALMTFGMYAMRFLMPLYLQSVGGASALTAGFQLLPMSVAFVVVSQLTGVLSNMFGPRVMTVGGMSCMGLGMFLLASATAGHEPWLIEAALLVVGIGLGLNTAPVQNVAVASVPQERAGTASGLVNTARMAGATLGVAVLGLLFVMHGSGSGNANAFGPPLLVGGAAEMLGAVLAFWFVSADALKTE
jgi:predicted MFS family arabinose efflux permease